MCVFGCCCLLMYCSAEGFSAVKRGVNVCNVSDKTFNVCLVVVLAAAVAVVVY